MIRLHTLLRPLAMCLAIWWLWICAAAPLFHVCSLAQDHHSGSVAKDGTCPACVLVLVDRDQVAAVVTPEPVAPFVYSPFTPLVTTVIHSPVYSLPGRGPPV